MTLETDDLMGISSVTQAPRWRHAGAAVRREPRLVLRGAAPLELVSADPDQLVFAGRQPPLAPILLTPLLLVLGSLPWLAPRPIDAVRAATSGAFVAVACGVAAWAWPRRRRLEVLSKASHDPSTASARTEPGRLAQPGRLRWVLDAEYTPNALSAAYTVALEPDDGGAYTVLRNLDPERLLRQFSEVLRHWPGPVDCRWNLPTGARPWRIEPHSGPRTLDEGRPAAVVDIPLTHRPLIWCARIMAALVITDLILLVTSAAAELRSIHPLSLILPCLLASGLVALALGLRTGGWRLRIAARVQRDVCSFGLCRARGSVRTDSVRGVYALGVAGAERWHLLVDSSDGPLALPVRCRDAEPLARAAERAISSSRSSR
jgi:hypothetical protein